MYAMSWSVRPDKRFRLALGSFVEEYNNKVRSATSAGWGGRELRGVLQHHGMQSQRLLLLLLLLLLLFHGVWHPAVAHRGAICDPRCHVRRRSAAPVCLCPAQVQLVSLEEESSEFLCRNTFDHPYPTTKIMWIPDTKGVYPDLLATSGDYLRIWRVGWIYCLSVNQVPWKSPNEHSLNTCIHLFKLKSI